MSKKIKILFVAEELSTNGAMMSLIALLNAIPRDKYDISLFVFRHSGTLMNKIPSDVRLLPESLAYVVHRMPLKQAISKTMKKGRLDLMLYRLLVSAQRGLNLSYNLWPFLPKIQDTYDVACCYADGFVAPMIIHKVRASKKACWIHFLYTDNPQPKYVYKALKTCDICVPVSLEAGNALDNALGEKINKHVVHNIIDAAECIEKADESCEQERKRATYRILSVGRLSKAKNFEIIPDVADVLVRNKIDFEWYIIGTGDLYQELLMHTTNMRLSDRVHFIGSKENPMPWIKSADVFVNPSRSESWGMTVSEALCLGKAVVTSDIPVFAEQITNGINGIMCPATPSAIAESIMKICIDENLRYRLEKNAVKYPITKKYVIAEFDAMINRLFE